MTLGTLNTLEPGAARDALAACCGAPRWLEHMLGARPFASRASLLAASDEAFRRLSADDIGAAAAHHPRIGELAVAVGGNPRSGSWSGQEQSGALNAGEALCARFREANAQYERRFGRTFIVCADGRGGAELLSALLGRMTNEPASELAATADELRKITALRLGKLLDEP